MIFLQIAINLLSILILSNLFKKNYNIFFRSFMALVLVIDIFYFSYIAFESYTFSNTIVSLLIICLIIILIIKYKKISSHISRKLNLTHLGVLLIVLLTFSEIYTRELIAGDALAVYYLKAKAIYYQIPIVEMPTASYSLYPSILWLILCGMIGIELGADFSRYFFPVVAVLAFYGIYYESYKKYDCYFNKSYLLLFTITPYILLRISGFYPITMGYFDWFVGLFLMYLTYLLIYDEEPLKINYILILSTIGLIKLEGIIYLNIIFFIFLIKKYNEIKLNKKNTIYYTCLIVAMNFLSYSYILLIKYKLGIFDYQSLSFVFLKSPFTVLSLMNNEFFNFIKEAILIIIIYLASLCISKNGRIYQILILLLIYFSYFFIYYFNTVDISWHIATSFQRLLYQIVPLIILFSYINFRKLEK